MYLVGVCGASASGKTTLCQEIRRALGKLTTDVGIVAMGSFHKTRSPAELADVDNCNFYHPDEYDFPAIDRCLRELRDDGLTQVPKYCFETHSRLSDTELVTGDVVFFEGSLALHDERVRELLDLTIFVECDLDVCLIRRIRRDMREEGRSVDSVLLEYERTVKPTFEAFVKPLRQYADVIVPGGGENSAAVRWVTEHIERQLLDRGYTTPGAAAAASSIPATELAASPGGGGAQRPAGGGEPAGAGSLGPARRGAADDLGALTAAALAILAELGAPTQLDATAAPTQGGCGWELGSPAPEPRGRAETPPPPAVECLLFPGVRCAPGTEGLVAAANRLLEAEPVEEVLNWREVESVLRQLALSYVGADEPPPQWAGGASTAAAGAPGTIVPPWVPLPRDPDWSDNTACPELAVGGGQWPLRIVGDVHGQRRDFLDGILGPVLRGEESPSRWLFLGDYLDRGAHSIDTFVLLALLRSSYPEFVTMLRGNHEDALGSVDFNTRDESARKYPDAPQLVAPSEDGRPYAAVWLWAIAAACRLPVAAVVHNLGTGKRIFCVHGGLSPALVGQGADPVDMVRTLKRFRYGTNSLNCCINPDAVEPLSPTSRCCLDGMLWSDPADGSVQGEQFLVSSRGAGYEWSADISEAFCRAHSLEFIARGHQLVAGGFRWDHNCRVLTIFSASNYCGVAGNLGAVMRLDASWAAGHPPSFRTHDCPPLPEDAPVAPPHLQYFSDDDALQYQGATAGVDDDDLLGVAAPPPAAATADSVQPLSKGKKKKAEKAARKAHPRWLRERVRQSAEALRAAAGCAAAHAALAACQRAAAARSAAAAAAAADEELLKLAVEAARCGLAAPEGAAGCPPRQGAAWGTAQGAHGAAAAAGSAEQAGACPAAAGKPDEGLATRAALLGTTRRRIMKEHKTGEDD
eukprot:TRINITY_DN5702_c0_g2_i1.p1 TRINITY_DN5702_c0_g2~~TRINITY_DN5702_c0_g2_i1.p1  ORF type:complete len:921 (+),score=212.40 TRINITY_DN5702_c0_g2_i1:90-2852(+)